MPYKDPAKQKEYLAKHYNTNKGKYAEASRKAREVRREKLKTIKQQNPCADCGVSYPWYVMDFDHVSDDKVNDISWMIANSSWADILLEIAKCELVCSNCHRERTWQRKQT